MKFITAAFFTLIFSILLITPTVISLVDDNLDISFCLNLNEEEENNGNEISKDVELKIHLEESFDVFLLNAIQKKKNISFCYKNYDSEYQKITTPPPEVLS